jgi:hypothetical protein
LAEIVGSRSASLIITVNRTGRVQPEQEDGTGRQEDGKKFKECSRINAMVQRRHERMFAKKMWWKKKIMVAMLALFGW